MATDLATSRFGVFVTLSGILLACAAQASDAGRAPGWPEVDAIFALRCVHCHSIGGAGKGLRLDSRAEALRGSEEGRVLLPGDPGGSELFRRITGTGTPRMPFLGPPLPPEEVEVIRQWIAAGLPE